MQHRSFFPSPTPCGPGNAATSFLLTALSTSRFQRGLNSKWVVFNSPLQNVRLSSHLSAEAKSSTHHSPQADISPIQHIMKNAKKASGKWQYLKVKVTLGRPLVGPHAAALLSFHFSISSSTRFTFTPALWPPLL